MVPLNSRWSRVTDHSLSLYTLHTSPALSQSLSSLSTNTRAHKNLSTLDKSLQQKTISKPVKHLLHMFMYVISPPQKSQAESKTSLQLFRAHRKFPNLTASTSVRDFLFHRRTSLLTPQALSLHLKGSAILLTNGNLVFTFRKTLTSTKTINHRSQQFQTLRHSRLGKLFLLATAIVLSSSLHRLTTSNLQ